MSEVIYLDLQKAFDRVVHDILLNKLESVGISGHLLWWFHAYLNDLHQCVSINNSVSDLIPVSSGVPQGSILGTLLFLLFINNLPETIHHSQLLLFANDTKCIHTITEHPSPLSSVTFQCDLDALCQSMNKGIHFNDSKNVTMRFLSTKAQALSPYHYLNNKPIPTVTSH
uniref:Reverse transcriptase domain-containing protein n=1 Tax=Amphimedon queenslandica TaxID=400682 RepID=A0A1X7UQ77_AMPQE